MKSLLEVPTSKFSGERKLKQIIIKLKQIMDGICLIICPSMIEFI